MSNRTQSPPLATGGNVARINRKLNWIIILAIVIIILLLLWWYWPWAIKSNINQSNDLICPQYESILCFDADPCTLDLISDICGNVTNNGGGSSCTSKQCKNVPLADGACCNAQDYCYYPDDTKTCIDGTCRSSNASLCKGFCNGTNATCPPLPLTINPNNTITECIFNSCTTISLITAPVVNPYELIDTSNGNITNLNIESCLTATCVRDTNFDPVASVCFFNWACAPYLGINGPGKKRVIFDENETIIKFPIIGQIDRNYKLINNELNDVLSSLKHKYLLRKQSETPTSM